MPIWIFYSFFEELDVLIILKKVPDIQLKIDVSLSKKRIDDTGIGTRFT